MLRAPSDFLENSGLVVSKTKLADAVTKIQIPSFGSVNQVKSSKLEAFLILHQYQVKNGRGSLTSKS